MIEPITIDFETEAIVGNPITNPPLPVGCAVYVPGEAPAYYAWGHPSENNISYADFAPYYTQLVKSGYPLLFHNAGFDISVGNAYFANSQINIWMKDQWRLVHDTLFLVFLADPYASTFSLKPSADRWLDLPPTEQEDLKEWILKTVPEATPKTFGAWICRAPGGLVGRYAIGDVVRTRKLFDLLHAKIVETGQEEAYDRERKLLPLLMDGTRRGVRVDRGGLERDLARAESSLICVDDQICTTLGCDRDTLDNQSALANSIESSGAITEWVLTKTGKRSMAKENLRWNNAGVGALFQYRSNLKTLLQTFLRPWLEKSAGDGRLHPNWNQVRQSRGGYNDASKGARTGRMSSDDPNFQNVPTEFLTQTGEALPTPSGCIELPNMRRYVLPEKGCIWIKRDFSSQEIRILAHFEDGSLCEAYRANPNLDPHQMARDLIASMIGITYARKSIKITGFSIIYGTGGPGLAGQLGIDVEEARRIKAAYLDAMPGIRDLMYDVQRRGRRGESIRTWGGRLYFVEPSKIVDGQMRDFAYKLLNYLVQGSAADQTKQSLNDWNANRYWEDTFTAAVHDEINISVPVERRDEAMQSLQRAMDSERLDVPMSSEGFTGPNWADLEKYDDNAAQIAA